MPRISVIVCTYNRAHQLENFINRLESHILSSNLDVEIVLVDNNSSDETPKILELYKYNAKVPVIIAHETHQGANYARNTGIKTARSEILVFTDDDVDFSDNWLTDFANYMEKYPEYPIVTGKIIPKFSIPQPEWLPDSMLAIYGQQNYGDSPVDINFPDFPVEMNIAVRSEIFQRYGGFNTEFSRDAKSLMSNDGKFFFHILSQHRQVVRYIPNACLFHLIPKTRINQKWVIRRYFWQGVSDVAFQHLISQKQSLTEIFSAIYELKKLFDKVRGNYISPRKIYWHWNGLTVESKAWIAYEWGSMCRKLGWK